MLRPAPGGKQSAARIGHENEASRNQSAAVLDPLAAGLWAVTVTAEDLAGNESRFARPVFVAVE